MPNALLVYPEFPPSYWGGKFALDFVDKKSSMPPLGLLTVAGMFPSDYQLKVVDMNVMPLTSADLNWADLVFTSTMIVQKDSLQEVIERCNRAGIPIIAGGPHPTSFYEDIEGVDHFVLDEVEDILSDFLQDLKNGTPQRIYRAPAKPDVSRAPLPRYDLINVHDYGSMALQFSRGCPFDCEFCDITKLFGRVPRTKTNEQVLAEFDLLYNLGWRGSLFLVDDNFIGNKRAAMSLLPDIARWQKERDFPFSLFTEASVNLARLEPLMDAMVDAGFATVFLGIETPNPEALLKTKKKQNTRKGEENYLI
ncbi:MAG: B12-binding domain-containing radical SAM protein, partial [Acidobacteriota bacterium]